MLALLALLAGCARPTGDFGRVEPDPLHDEAMPVAGDFLAGKTGRPVSAFNLTDQERDMRNRIWRYLVDQHVYEWFGPTVTELQRTSILPLDARPLATDRYYQWLHRQSFASSRVRYAKLSDDAELDTELIAPTFASICAVLDVDRQRGIAADATPGLEESMKANA
ncbi:MAG TPA: hypothetical protein VHZ56_12280, partial [Devosia sp.]|nr:hypothetical protein [Devosia sp.]